MPKVTVFLYNNSLKRPFFTLSFKFCQNDRQTDGFVYKENCLIFKSNQDGLSI